MSTLYRRRTRRKKAGIIGRSLGLFLLFLLLGGLLLSPPVGAAGVPQGTPPPRPTLTPTPTATLTPTPTIPVSITPTSTPSPLEAQASFPSLQGRVINLADGTGVAGVPVKLVGVDNWSVEATTDAEGNYAFGRLGYDVGLLNIVLEEGNGLEPVTQDIAIVPRPELGLVVNLGVRGDNAGPLPLVPSLEVSRRTVNQGDVVTFTVRVQNDLETKVSGVMVTDLLPQGLALSGVRTSRGDPFTQGNYAAAYVGDLGPGEEVVVEIVADVTDGAFSPVVNRVSLIYREHAAAQATVQLNVHGAQPAMLPVTGFGLPLAGIVLAAALLLFGWLRRRAAAV